MVAQSENKQMSILCAAPQMLKFLAGTETVINWAALLRSSSVCLWWKSSVNLPLLFSCPGAGAPWA